MLEVMRGYRWAFRTAMLGLSTTAFAFGDKGFWLSWLNLAFACFWLWALWPEVKMVWAEIKPGRKPNRVIPPRPQPEPNPNADEHSAFDEETQAFVTARIAFKNYDPRYDYVGWSYSVTLFDDRGKEIGRPRQIDGPTNEMALERARNAAKVMVDAYLLRHYQETALFNEDGRQLQ